MDGPDTTQGRTGAPIVAPPTGEGRRFELHAFHCVYGPNCPFDGPAEEILTRFKARLKESPLAGRVRFNKSGCLDQCGHGPMMVVYPEGVWYAHLGLDDVDRIFDEHIVGGHPVEELRYRTPGRPGKNKLPSRPGEPPDTSHPAYHPCNRCPWGPPTAP